MNDLRPALRDFLIELDIDPYSADALDARNRVNDYAAAYEYYGKSCGDPYVGLFSLFKNLAFRCQPDAFEPCST